MDEMVELGGGTSKEEGGAWLRQNPPFLYYLYVMITGIRPYARYHYARY